MEADQVVDLTISADEWEEIRIYLDLERGVDGAHVYVDDHGEVVQTIMTSMSRSRR